MNKAKKLRIASFGCVLVVIAGVATASLGRKAASTVLPILGFLAVVGGFIAMYVIDRKLSDVLAERQAAVPMTMELAQIVGRRVAHIYRAGSRGSVHSSDVWCMTFKTSRHGNVELGVPWDVWKENPNGTSGELQYQGKRFISFKKR